MRTISRRSVVASAAGAVPCAAAAAEPTLNDASKLSSTPIRASLTVNPLQPTSIESLRRALRTAGVAGQPVVVGGARHSMGAQSLPRDGLAVRFASFPITVDSKAGIYRVSSGARWREVITALDRHGFSPKVMQSNNDFSVGGTFSVNAHGWPVPFGPMGSTVRAFRLMLANGEMLRVTRDSELFGLAMGGYGLLGMILDFELEMTPNYILAPKFEVLPAEQMGRRFLAALQGPDPARMAYGRLNVASEGFLEAAALITFRGDKVAKAGQAGTGDGSVVSTLTRSVYRAQLGSEAMKRARWYAETQLSPAVQPKSVTRNALLNTPVRLLEERDPRRTDILHEYFVDPAQLPGFLAACRDVIPGSGIELLNVTLRYVAADTQSVLAFAPQTRIAAVMSFSQPITPEGERAMRVTTEALVERVLALGGSYYLPYRLHPRPDQFRRAYPRFAAFAEAKRRHDPKLVFRHALWDRYLA